jgi:hypothetical protein
MFPCCFFGFWHPDRQPNSLIAAFAAFAHPGCNLCNLALYPSCPLLPCTSDLVAPPPCSWGSSWQLGGSWTGTSGAGTSPRARSSQLPAR